MTLSFSKLNEIAYLYENAVHGEQEVLCEAPGMDIFTTPAAQKSNASAVRPFYTRNPGTGMDVLKGAPGKTIDQAQKNKAAETIFKLPSGSLSKPSAKKPAATTPARAGAARPAAPAPARPAAPKPATAAPAAARPPAATTGNPPLKPPALPPVPGRESLASQAAELRNMQAASRQRQGLTQSFDVFDVIKGHLIDEGYADTNEAALAIMANMSEEWREGIVEEVLDERNRGERDMIDLQVRRRRDIRDGDTTSGATYVKAGGSQRSDHENSRGTKKVKGRVSASMRGPNDNVSNYHASSEEN